MSFNFLPSRSKSLSCERGVLFVLREKSSAVNSRALQHGIGLRNQFFPGLAIVVAGVGDEDAVARRIFIGRDVDFAVVNFAGIEKIFPVVMPRGRSADFTSIR